MTSRKQVQLIDELPDWLPRQAWEGWLDIRRQLKAKINARVIALALRELDILRQAGEDLELVIDQSSARNWLSFYPYKGPKPQPQAAPQETPGKSPATGGNVGYEQKDPRGSAVRDVPAVAAPRKPMPADVRATFEKLLGRINMTRH